MPVIEKKSNNLLEKVQTEGDVRTPSIQYLEGLIEEVKTDTSPSSILTHESTYDHDDIALNTAERHEQNTDHSLDFSAGLALDLSSMGIRNIEVVDTNNGGFGNPLKLSSDGHYDDADASNSTSMPCTALALDSGTGSIPILLEGFIRDDSWSWTPGGLLYINSGADSSGVGLTQTPPSGSGEQVQVVGYAKSATIVHFKPSLVVVELA